MSWNVEMPLIVRSWINDLSDTPTYSDERVQQLIVVAAQYVIKDVDLTESYTVNIVNPDITPDPTLLAEKDLDFISLTSLKASCILDQSSLRTRAATDGIRASLGPAQLAVGGGLRGYEVILNKGPCAMYDKLVTDFQIGNVAAIHAILGPFVGNKFDPRYLQDSSDRSRNFYS
jgi:hypothetical protein